MTSISPEAARRLGARAAVAHAFAQCGRSAQRWRRWHVRDISRGVLESEEHLVWAGSWPGDQAHERVPALMAAAYVRSIRRFSLGLIRCHVTDTGVDCRLLDGPTVLSLVDESAERAAGRIVRRWRITPGLLARATHGAGGLGSSPGALGAAAPLGTLALGVERCGPQAIHAWMRVQAFPSRFLGPVPLGTFGPPASLPRRGPRVSPPDRALAWAWAVIGRLYATYHSRTAYSALGFLARSLGGIA